MKTLTITVALSAKAAVDLPEFVPVDGRWEINDATMQHLIEEVAAEHAAEITKGELNADEFKVQLFREDGRSLDGSDGITNGSLLVKRKP